MTSLTDVYATLTERQKAVWSAGDWPTIADASSEVVEKLGRECASCSRATTSIPSESC